MDRRIVWNKVEYKGQFSLGHIQFQPAVFQVAPGCFAYRFRVDKEWKLAPGAEVEENKEGEQVSILVVEEEEEEDSQQCGGALKDNLTDTKAKKINVGGV